MSNYTKTTDFTAKDALAIGDPDKLIVGAEIDSEFDAIATAVATKANSAEVPTLAGTNTFTGVNEVSSAAPQLRFNETDAGANAKCWSFEVNGAALGLYLRADSFGASGTVPLYFVRSGNALSSIAIDAGGASNDITINGRPIISSTQPDLYFNDTDAAANNQRWRLSGSAEQFFGQARSDDNSTGNNWLAVDRTGTTIDSIALSATFVSFSNRVKFTPVTVASLPSASTAGAGAKYFVSDANATTFASVVAGGGANNVPVYSDGTNWRIG